MPQHNYPQSGGFGPRHRARFILSIAVFLNIHCEWKADRLLSLVSCSEYYHQKLAPSSDVDLFIWGLDEGAALEKIQQIESSVRNAILEEVTVSSHLLCFS